VKGRTAVRGGTGSDDRYSAIVFTGRPACKTTSSGPLRPYRSVKHEAAAPQTRRTIRDAAETLFLRDGYARTSMKAIAAQAGVSEKTMYLAYATKATLLRRCPRQRPHRPPRARR
jgi:tetracycline repressor-like protein